MHSLASLFRFVSLTKREKEILTLVALGENSPKIAEKLFLSIETVNTHRKNIRQKLGILTSYEFLQYAHAFDLL